MYFVQALGRGARKTEVAHDCVVIDFGGNVARHGALDMIKPVEVRAPKTKSERETAEKSAFKQCKKCGEDYADFFESCPHCGYDSRLDREVGGDLLLRSKEKAILVEAKTKPLWLEVKGPPRRTPNRHWSIPLTTGTAVWWPAHLPATPVHVYAQWSARWGFVAEGIIDEQGTIHRP